MLFRQFFYLVITFMLTLGSLWASEQESYYDKGEFLQLANVLDSLEGEEKAYWQLKLQLAEGEYAEAEALAKTQLSKKEFNFASLYREALLQQGKLDEALKSWEQDYAEKEITGLTLQQLAESFALQKIRGDANELFKIRSRARQVFQEIVEPSFEDYLSMAKILEDYDPKSTYLYLQKAYKIRPRSDIHLQSAVHCGRWHAPAYASKELKVALKLAPNHIELKAMQAQSMWSGS